MLDPQIHSDAELWDLETETGYPIYRAFTGVWNFSDREGRFEWKPRQLKALILPFWDGDFSRVLDALATRGFLVRYECNGSFFGVVRSFHKHQSPNGRESESTLPAPPKGFERFPMVGDASSTRERRVKHATSTLHDGSILEGSILEGSGREGKARAARDEPPPLEPMPAKALEPEPAVAVAVIHRAPPPQAPPPPELEQNEPEPADWRSAAELVRKRFGARFDRARGNPPAWSAKNLAHCATIGAWLDEKNGDHEKLLSRMLDGFFADAWALEHGFPLGALAGDPSRYFSPPKARRDARSGYLAPAPASAFTSPTNLDDIFGPETSAGGE